VPAAPAIFMMENGSVKVTIPKRNFRILLIEAK